MAVGPLASDVVVAFCLAACVLYRYGNWFRHHIIVTLAVLLAWYFSFLIIFVLPLDVSAVSMPVAFNGMSKIFKNTYLANFFFPQTVYRQCIQKNNLTELVIGNSSSTTEAASSPSIICRKPWSNVPDHTFPNMWRIVYWTSQFLTWWVKMTEKCLPSPEHLFKFNQSCYRIIMPLMQSYTQAGDFTVRGKLKSALVDNAIYYGSYLFIAAILLIYLALKPHMELDW